MENNALISELIIQKSSATAYTIKNKTLDGKSHLVVPVVMMVEGVHAGSRGAIFHPISELGKFPASWNGIPVVIHHPQQDGNFISANSPEVPYVGRVYNTTVDGDKLKAEVYIDEQKITAISPTALAYIRQGKQLEVSVGVFTDEDSTEGEWNGEAYIARAINHRPDHLALLPGDTGACSWNDGCGIRANKLVTNQKQNESSMEQIVKPTLEELITNGVGSALQLNETSLSERIGKVQSKLYSLDSENEMYYLEEVYSEYFIFNKRNSEGGTMYKQAYSFDAAGNVEFVGEPVKVKKEVSYININLNKEVDMAEKSKKTPCCLAKVEQLIANKATSFTAEDTAWLLEQDEETLDKLFPVTTELQANEAPQVNKEQALQVLRDSLKTSEDFINILPKEMQDQMKSGLALHKSRRNDLVTHITANSNNAFSAEELNVMDTGMLEKIAKALPTPVDYSINGMAPEINTDNSVGEILLPYGVTAA